MQKRIALILLLALALPAAAARHKEKAAPAPPAVSVDGHEDTPSEYLKSPFDLGVVNKRGSVDYPRMKEGGLDAAFFAAYVPAKYANKGAAAYCMTIMETIHEMVDRYPNWARFAASTSDIRSAAKDGKRAILIGIEGGHAIEDSLELLRAFYRFGARYMTLTHFNSNNWADSSGDAPKHNGLTPFGKEVVLEMNRLGMLVDVSHVSDKTFWDTIETSKAPIIASHSSARALASHPRNMTDDMLRALAKNGGVAMVNFYPVFLSDEVAASDRERDKKLAADIAALKVQDPSEGAVYDAGIAKLYAENPIPTVSYTRIADHIDHIVKIAGIDHVGIGSDFDGVTSTPVGMEDVSKLPSLRAELKKRGYSESDIHKIMGENFMRVFAEVERVGKTMR
ncbi:MAG TPA: dipeptidase [Thermoanaerobaculia bacterium]|jgi:membrane dipeptidase|nr:dipeptidase [Thermoanaerobaculia bacterium]